MPVIANTTVISNFAIVGQLELLHAPWDTLYISDQVYNEIQDGLFHGYDFYDNIDQLIFPFSKTGWLHLTALRSPEEFRLFGELLSTLHSGEASCLSIAHHRQWTFLSDDKAARQVGARIKVPVSGTVGLLLSLVKRRLLALGEADAILGRMIQKGYYSPVASLNEILQG